MPRTSTLKKAAAFSPAKAADAPTRFSHHQVAGEPGYVVTDQLTGLQWSHTLNAEGVVHAKAQGLVDKLNTAKHGGHSDWRLPEVEELFLIADRSTRNPAIDKAVFPGTESDWYWTKTPFAGDSDYAWIVYFYLGSALWYDRNDDAFVRAVRGPVARARQ